MLNAYTHLFLRFLTRSWHEINQTVFQGRLQTPVFAIGEGERRLGSWHGGTRTLSISGNTLLRHSELEILEVLKHEMAHQYADEVLAVDRAGETPHGSGFRHACTLLGIEHHAQMAPKQEASPLLARIRKLLALAESHNEHEAAAAMAKAHELISKYELSLGDDETPFFHRFLGAPRKQRPAVDQLIASVIVRFFNVEAVWIPSVMLTGGKKVWLLEINGSQENLNIADYVYTYLHRELEGLWRGHKRRHPQSKGKTPKRDYQVGVLRGFSEKLAQDQCNSDSPGQALMVLRKERLQQFFRERHNNTQRGRRMTYRDSETYRAGFADGGQLNIRKGLTQGDGPTPALDRGRLLES